MATASTPMRSTTHATMSPNSSSVVAAPRFVMFRLGDSPITPRRRASALIASVVFWRPAPYTPLPTYSRGLACVIATGTADRSIASSVVRSPQWERSIRMPTRFISSIALRPKREEMPVSFSSQ